jgi:hypothetical protein
MSWRQNELWRHEYGNWGSIITDLLLILWYIYPNQIISYRFILICLTWTSTDKACILEEFRGLRLVFRYRTGGWTSSMYRVSPATGTSLPLSSSNCWGSSQAPSFYRALFMQTSRFEFIKFKLIIMEATESLSQIMNFINKEKINIPRP